MIATGLAGAQKCGYGPPRAYVIGMRVALADGRVIKAGGRVVKNVAGYDLCKLFTGSYGSLGVILEITFKVRPRPQCEATVLASAPATSLLQGARAILDQRLFPVALEILSPGMARRLDIEIGTNECLLLARFAGNAKGVTFQSDQAGTTLRSQSTVIEVAEIAEDQFIWQKLAAVPLQLQDQQGLRAVVLPSNLGKLIEGIEARENLLWHAGVADGRVRVIDTGSSKECAASFEGMKAAAGALGGSVTIENVSADFDQTVEVTGHAPERNRLMQRIKHELDPHRLFSGA